MGELSKGEGAKTAPSQLFFLSSRRPFGNILFLKGYFIFKSLLKEELHSDSCASCHLVFSQV